MLNYASHLQTEGLGEFGSGPNQTRQHSEEPCTLFLEEEEWKVLYCIANRTAIPPQVAPTMKDAVSYFAKLGGFLGRKGDGEPGVKVIWRGLNELNTVLKYYRYTSP